MTPSNVFLNVPFDAHYKKLFLALVTGVVAHGARPRCVLELPSSQGRLARLKALVRNCDVSFHDLSRVSRSPSPQGPVPRFNMPFELGLAVMEDHRFFVLEERAYRLQASLSDLNGFDPLIHNGNPHRLLLKLKDALHSRRYHPTHAQLVSVYDRVCRTVFEQLRSTGADLFSRSVFDDACRLAVAECQIDGLI